MLPPFQFCQYRFEPLPCGIVRSRIVESLVVPRRILFVCGSLENRRDQRAGFRFRRLPCVNRLSCKFHFMLLFSIVHSSESFAWSRSLISSSHNKSLKCFDCGRNLICSALISLCFNDPAHRSVFFQASNDQRQSGALRLFDGSSLNQITAAIRKLQALFKRELWTVPRL